MTAAVRTWLATALARSPGAICCVWSRPWVLPLWRPVLWLVVAMVTAAAATAAFHRAPTPLFNMAWPAAIPCSTG